MIKKLLLNLEHLAENKQLCSPILVNLKQKDVAIMEQASLELFSLLDSDKYNAFHVENTSWFKNDRETGNNHQLGMLGFDFHVTAEGPRLIEINSNAGGLVTSSIWSHRKDSSKLENVLSMFARSFTEEFQRFKHHPAKTMVIVDNSPKQQFTFYDLLLTQQLMEAFGLSCDIADVNDQLDGYDIIYNRSCDFMFERNEMKCIKKIYQEGNACVVPNPYMFSRLSDKRALITLYNYLKETSDLSLPFSRQVVLPCMHIHDFVEAGLKRSGWFFKPAMAYGGYGVYRGRKISMVKFKEIAEKDFIAQKAAVLQEIDYQDESYKYDIRVFAWRGNIIDLSVRTYQGRITNFRTPNGGYASFTVD